MATDPEVIFTGLKDIIVSGSNNPLALAITCLIIIAALAYFQFKGDNPNYRAAVFFSVFCIVIGILFIATSSGREADSSEFVPILQQSDIRAQQQPETSTKRKNASDLFLPGKLELGVSGIEEIEKVFGNSDVYPRDFNSWLLDFSKRVRIISHNLPLPQSGLTVKREAVLDENDRVIITSVTYTCLSSESNCLQNCKVVDKEMIRELQKFSRTPIGNWRNRSAEDFEIFHKTSDYKLAVYYSIRGDSCRISGDLALN
ncbi:hypothetical protein [Paracoccus shandongensis]|uniref:hypothetical protein n=1 Tax=Paracoccus shandongensis TaxID=2816048 RepID=UPI001A8FDA5D|nr:hypothetical protein [Paracoccus shandongensis]